MIESFIYDFDGTLSDSYPIFLKILKEIIHNHNGKTDCTDAQLYRLLKNRNAEGYAAVTWPDHLTSRQFTEEFAVLQGKYANDFQLFPHAKEILAAAIEQGKHIPLK